MTDPSQKPQNKKVTQSKDFRIIFTNLFTIRFGDNDVLMRFAMELDASDSDAPTIEEVGVVMTPRSAKLFRHALTEAINAFEATTGQIQVPQSKLDRITESLQRQVGERSSPEE